MRRREFIGVFVGAATTWTRGAYAQQSERMRRIGFLNAASSSSSLHIASAFRRGLSEAGYVEGRNLTIEYHWAEGRYDRLPALAADLVNGGVAVIAAGAPAAVLAAKSATSSIPIVFTTGADPARMGVVASLNRPGGNITGVHFLTAGLEAKRFGLLQELLQPSDAIAVLFNPNNPTFGGQLKAVNEAARAVGRPIHIVEVRDNSGLEAAYAKIAQLKPGALLVASDPALNSWRQQLVALSARHGIPTMYQWREFAEVGGLMSYGTNIADGYRQSGIYVGRILKGEKPAEMPVLQPTKFELVINLKTARSLGLTIPPGVLAIADEVIE
jgi:putative ABC transport system substrate-binding protein